MMPTITRPTVYGIRTRWTTTATKLAATSRRRMIGSAELEEVTAKLVGLPTYRPPKPRWHAPIA
jgi:hypothetical protein